MATSAAIAGVSDAIIKTLGQWQGSAYTLYIRTPSDQLRVASWQGPRVREGTAADCTQDRLLGLGKSSVSLIRYVHLLIKKCFKQIIVINWGIYGSVGLRSGGLLLATPWGCQAGQGP